MKTITTKWFTDSIGPKIFYSDYKRIQIIDCPISQLESFKQLFENDLNFQGIYILVGFDGEKNYAYIGETDSIRNRLATHFKSEEKAFAERVLIISSKDNLYHFSKTELHYIEKSLIRKFENSEYEVKNANRGQGKEPSVIERLNLDEEFELILLGLDSFGINLEKEETISTPAISVGSNERTDVEVYALIPKTDVKILGVLHSDNSLTVKKGAVIKRKCKPGGDSPAFTTRSLNLIKNNGKAIVEGSAEDYFVEYLDDIRYKSPSAASGLIDGGVTNGWLTWKVATTGEPIDKFRK